METTTTLGAITPGRIISQPSDNSQDIYVLTTFDDRVLAEVLPCDVLMDEAEANANLYANAHNTAQKTGKLPSQLKQDVDELVVKLREAEKCLRGASEWMHVKRARMPIAEIDAFLSTLDLPKP